jgi:SAM-dependent methyltransferase
MGVTACLHCGATPEVLWSDIRDYEYGVPWRSQLLQCPRCGLVVHAPRVTADDIEKLYPETYHAHAGGGGGAGGRGLYWRLRKLLARSTLRGLLPHVARGGRLLEVGCGNGSFLKLIAEARPDVELHGVDIVDTGITGIAGFTFHQGQLEQIDLPESSFDAIYFSNLIEHVPDPFVFLRRCRRLLRPSGIVYGNTPDHLSLDRYLFGKYWAGYHYPRHTFLFDHRNMREILHACGFSGVRLSGSYAFWALSLKNVLQEGHGPRQRGLGHAAITGLALPFDLMVNVVRCHGSMTFAGTAGSV